MHGQQQRRRKKRPTPGTKIVEIARGKTGYGFTISSQQPCLLSCIVNNSPAERAGLKTGDLLFSVNGENVSRAPHDDVVRLIGSSRGTLTLQIGENNNTSESSDEDYQLAKHKAKYPHRVRARSNNRTDKITADLNTAGLFSEKRIARERAARKPRSRSPGSQDRLSGKETFRGPKWNDQPSRKADSTSKQNDYGRRRDPQPQSKYHSDSNQGTRRNEHKKAPEYPPGGHIVDYNYRDQGSTYLQQQVQTADVRPKNSYFQPDRKRQYAEDSRRRMLSPPPVPSKPTSQERKLPRSNSTPDISVGNEQGAVGGAGVVNPDNYQSAFTPQDLSNILYPSLQPHVMGSSSTINENELPTLRVMVGYAGTIEIPCDSNLPNSRLQSIRSAVRRLRVEQKIHTLVLLEAFPDGIRLTNAQGMTIAHYPASRLAFSGVSPEDKRFFGFVTLNITEADEMNVDESNESEEKSSSCHVFMVNPELRAHNAHLKKARSFGIKCTTDPESKRCLEFPKSASPILRTIAKLYRHQGGFLEEAARGLGGHHRSNSNSSNSDSGLGFYLDEGMNPSNRVQIVDMYPDAIPPGMQVVAGQRVDWGNRPVLQYVAPPRVPDVNQRRDTFQGVGASNPPPPPADANLSHLSSTASPLNTSVLNLRARPDPVSSPSPGKQKFMEDQNSAENLRRNMQRILQSRQQQCTSTYRAGMGSDVESVCSSYDIESGSSKHSAHLQRPLSAPIESHLRTSPVGSGTRAFEGSGRVTSKQLQIQSMDLATKLSPRAMLPSGSRAAAKAPSGGPSLQVFNTSSVPSHKHQNSYSGPFAAPSRPGPSMSSRGVGMHVTADVHSSDTSTDQRSDTHNASVRSMVARFEHEGPLVAGMRPSRRQTEGIQNHSDSSQNDQYNGWRRWSKGEPLAASKKKDALLKKQQMSFSHESINKIDSEFCEPRLTQANSVNSINMDANHNRSLSPDLGRVAGWQFSFEKLLQDPAGLATFTEFLKKEFSEENILFWITCENFRQITDPELIKLKANEIFERHLAIRATEPVNIDSTARKTAEQLLDDPTNQMFALAQRQIFQLMKHDSYSRFLKSELYKECVLCEVQGRDLPHSGVEENAKENSKPKLKKTKSSSSNGTAGTEDVEKDRRKSFLPWNRSKGSKRVSKSSDTDVSKKGSKVKHRNAEDTSSFTGRSSLASGDLSLMSKELTQSKESLNRDNSSTAESEAAEDTKFCRVILPDHSTTVVYAKAGQSVKQVLSKLCERRDLSVAGVDVFQVGSEKTLDLTKDISSLASKEIRVESRVLFRMDLPNRKSIGVKAKPQRSIRDVFRPILNKYGFKIDDMVVHLVGSSIALDLDTLIVAIDNQRVVVQSMQDFAESPKKEWGGYDSRRQAIGKPPIPKKPGNLMGQQPAVSTITSRGHEQGDSNSDELVIMDFEKSKGDDSQKGLLGFIRRGSFEFKDKNRAKNKVTFASHRNLDNKTSEFGPKNRKTEKEDDHFFDLVTKVQSQRLDDQRGPTENQFELPDFLRSPIRNTQSDKENSPNRANHGAMPANYYGGHIPKSMSHPDRLEYGPGNQRLTLMFNNDCGNQTPQKDDLIVQDTSFSGEGYLPSHMQADEYFNGAYNYPGSPDFNDPQLMQRNTHTFGPPDYRQANLNRYGPPIEYHASPKSSKNSAGYDRRRSMPESHNHSLLDNTVVENTEDLNSTLISQNELNNSLPPPPSVMDGNLELAVADFPPPSPFNDSPKSVQSSRSSSVELTCSPYSRRYPKSNSVPFSASGLSSTIPGVGHQVVQQPLIVNSEESDSGTDIEPANCSASTYQRSPVSTPSPTTHDLFPSPENPEGKRNGRNSNPVYDDWDKEYTERNGKVMYVELPPHRRESEVKITFV